MTDYYTTSSEVRQALGLRATDTADDALIVANLPRVKDEIDTECKRTFVTTARARYYHQRAARIVGDTLYLGEDLYSLSSLRNADGTTSENGSVIATSDVWLDPPSGPPYGSITLQPGQTWIFNTTGRVMVSGDWGYSSSAPPVINQAATRLNCYYYKQKDAQVYDVQADAATGLVTVPKGMPDDIKRKIEHLKRRF